MTLDDWLKLFRGLELAGTERSIKLAQHGITSDRALIGMAVPPAGTAQPILDLTRRMCMPVGLYRQVERALPGANQILFGYEGGAAAVVCKVYLEYWDRLVTSITATQDRSPQLLHLGFKWRVDKPEPGRVARYICHPLLPITGIYDRLSQLYPAPCVSHTIAREVLATCAPNIPGDSFVYLEVEEEGNSRKSFDLNFYKAHMQMGDVRENVMTAGEAYGLDLAELGGCLDPIEDCVWGHLAGGKGAEDQDFLTFYYEM